MKASLASQKKLLVDEEAVKAELQKKQTWGTYHSLADFSNVVSLDLSDKSLLAIPCLLRLFNLRSLNLSNNSISVLNPNRLPPRLEILNLSWNEICELSKEIKGSCSVATILPDGQFFGG